MATRLRTESLLGKGPRKSLSPRSISSHALLKQSSEGTRLPIASVVQQKATFPASIIARRSSLSSEGGTKVNIIVSQFVTILDSYLSFCRFEQARAERKASLKKPPSGSLTIHDVPKTKKTAASSLPKTSDHAKTKVEKKKERNEVDSTSKGKSAQSGGSKDDGVRKKILQTEESDLEGDRAQKDEDEDEDVPLMTLKSIKRQVEREDVSEEPPRGRSTDLIELDFLSMEVQEEIARLKQTIEECDEEDILVEGLNDIIENTFISKLNAWDNVFNITCMF